MYLLISIHQLHQKTPSFSLNEIKSLCDEIFLSYSFSTNADFTIIPSDINIVKNWISSEFLIFVRVNRNRTKIEPWLTSEMFPFTTTC